ncbi:MAG: SIMPL domain-containing protein [Clostridia bacterium]
MKHAHIWLATAVLTAMLMLGCKAAEEIKPGPTPKPIAPEVIVNNEQAAPEHIIVVGGYGEVIVSPDYATITIGVSGTADTAEQASERCDTNLASVYEVAKTLGVLDRDITNAGTTITAQQRVNDGAITGYAATDIVIITANDVSTANTVMSGIIDAAICELKSITYSLADSSTAYQNALQAAMSDARQKAQTIADAGNVTLGMVSGVEETPHDDSKLVGVDFETSAIAVNAKVTVRFLIK